MARVLVLSPHPDDEAIGCGGALCRHVDQGDDVRLVFLTSGEAGGHGAATADAARVREEQALQFCRAHAELGNRPCRQTNNRISPVSERALGECLHRYRLPDLLEQLDRQRPVPEFTLRARQENAAVAEAVRRICAARQERRKATAAP